MTTVIVRFNAPSEFIDELRLPRHYHGTDGAPRAAILRLTRSFRPSSLSPNIKHVHVIATFRDRDEIVRLDRYCGDTWTAPQQSTEEAYEAAEKVMQEIEAAAKEAGYEVRAGVFEAAV